MKSLGKLALIVVVVLALAWFAIAGRYLVSPPIVLSGVVLLGVALLIRYKRKNPPVIHSGPTRSLAKFVMCLTFLLSAIMILGMGSAGAVLAIPVAGLGYLIFRNADRKQRNRPVEFTEAQKERLAWADQRQKTLDEFKKKRDTDHARIDAEVKAKGDARMREIFELLDREDAAKAAAASQKKS